MFRSRKGARLRKNRKKKSVRIIFEDKSESHEAISIIEALFLIRYSRLEGKITELEVLRLKNDVSANREFFASYALSEGFREYIKTLNKTFVDQISREMVSMILHG